MTKTLIKLQPLRSEKGATAVEYGLMVALIAVVIIVAVALLGHQPQHPVQHRRDKRLGIKPQEEGVGCGRVTPP